MKTEFTIGKKIGRLTIQKAVISLNDGRKYLKCLCDCGRKLMVLEKNVSRGATKSCGCLRSEITSARNRSHGLSNSEEYQIWCGIIKRCENRKSLGFKNYGGRGISICKRWRSDFNFFIKDMGKRPSKNHSIDRVDVNGNYSPENCRWASKSIQMRNTRRARFIDLNGEPTPLAEAAEKMNISKSTLYSRIKRNKL